MSDAIIFLGPTLPVSEARQVLPADYRPPVSQGDVLRAVMDQPAAIGIIDGYFENVPAVWHKEILFALDRGIPVFGAASMGALRAAELHGFGMVGVGAIFSAFLDGRLEDDDEVAVTHGPAELGYPLLSEAMVNIRRTLSDAHAAGVLSTPLRRHLECLAKAMPYKMRGYGSLLLRAKEAGVPGSELAGLRDWLPCGRADQKREDALDMLRTLGVEHPSGSQRPRPLFPFEHTVMWERAARSALDMPMTV
ncbi:TfuA-like protein [Oleisolibacter albus]|uniref:TfuA-like protein n=1 Tax=Oleisolibacter albus TaxID=2171757 RepID=UPI000DF30492|nr:TfuA-like protein [Oleisolibacter albus]